MTVENEFKVSMEDRKQTYVIIPAYNEEENIVRVVDNLINNYGQLDYVVINDGSRDNTAKLCREHGYNLVDLPVNLGLAGAFQAGMKYALVNDYDYAIQFDGDGQHNPQFIEGMEQMAEKENLDISEEEAKQTAKTVALAAVKYGDLSNQASKDYCFDIERFTSFEGNTGPYILYTIVRIKSILKKYTAKNSLPDAPILGAHSASEKNLMLVLSRFNAMMENAYEEKAPHKICAYIYELANAFNGFYHETKILSEEDFKVQASYIGLLVLTKNILETCIDVLGFSAPDRM